jgi:O-6-methylguanine DNA methyltransferase
MKNDLKYAIFKTKWGFFGLLANNKGLLRTVLPMKNYQAAKKYLLVGIFERVKESRELLKNLQNGIVNYYKGSYVNLEKLSLPIGRPLKTSFSVKVVKFCKTIPIGKTLTYSQVAKKVGAPKAARAVGNILAKNPLPLIVPCHRIIRADGKIGKFSAPGGTELKKKMLEHERRIATKTQKH